jgi:amino acid transporter
MTVTEVAILVVVIVAAGIEFAGRPAHAPATLAFSPAAFTPGLFATGALTALFFYWGWDVTVNLTEETRDPGRAPGRGSVLAMVAILMLFVAFAMVALMALTDEEIAESSTNVVFAVAEKLFPRPWSYVAIVAVMLSTVGTLETSILQFTRTLYAKGRDGTLHPRYASLHPAWRTPWAATAVITGFGLLLLFLSSFLPTVGQIIIDSVQSIGFQVALYYGLAGFACAWHSRHEALRSLSGLVFLVVWPTASACVLWVIAAYSIPAFDAATTVLGLGGIAVGAVPLWLNRRRRAAGTKASS